MGWSLQLGRVLGIPVRLHLTLLLLLGWLVLEGGGQANRPDATMPLLAVGLCACVLLHELGHALAARRLGIRVLDITLLPIGGLARMASVPRLPRHELVIACAGPLVNFILAPVLFVLHQTLEAPPADMRWVTGDGYLLGKLALLNLSLGMFNLIPAFPLDGGRIFRALLGMFMPHLQATRVATSLGQGIALAVAIFGIMKPVPFLIFLAFFLFVGAAEERARVQTQAFVEGVPVRDAMMTRFFTLGRADSLRQAVTLLISGTQRDFPVVEGSEMVGILTRRRLIEALRRGGEGLYVSEVMEPAPAALTPDDPLDRAVERLMAESAQMLPVCTEDGLCGLLTPAGATEYVVVRSAQQRPAPERSIR